jgi:nicotinamidase-related amidase
VRSSNADLGEILVPSRTALVLQELQAGVVGEHSPFPELAAAAAEVGVISNAIDLTRAARKVRVPVIHATAENLPGDFGANRNARLFYGARKAGALNAPGTASVQPAAGLDAAGDLTLPRYHGLSPLSGGPLSALLRNSGIDTIVLAGVSLNIAIPNVVYDAVNQAFRVVLVTDAVAGTPVEYGAQVLEHSLRHLATLATTSEVVAAWSRSGGTDALDAGTSH